MTTVEQLPAYLLRYFHQRGSVTVPGLGKLITKRSSSSIDIANRIINPPSDHLSFHENDKEISVDEMQYLMRRLSINEEDLKRDLGVISEQIHEKLSTEKKLEWMGMGAFVVDESGRIAFNPKQQYLEVFRSIPFTHVIRQNIQHEILVGDEQRLNTEMEEYFEEQRVEKKEKKWRRAAFALLLAACALLLARYMLGSFSVFEGRFSSFKAKEPRSIYRGL